MKLNFFILLFSFFVLFSVSGCSQVELASHFSKKLSPTMKSKGKYKVGSPYTIKGKRYYPEVDYGYNQTGIASWYGPNFHGKQTANGEIFDENELTAAHKTLPLPSIVRVTNLENGRSLIVRVNDRGPYAHSRIIDMSKRSAELLGFRIKGTAKVRVQVLEKESRMVAQMAQNNQDTKGVEVPMNRPGYKPKPATQQARIKTQPHPPAKVESVSLSAPNKGSTIPGHVRDGQFYPDPVVSEFPVHAARIYIQMGSFSMRENAMKFSSSLEGYGRAQIRTAVIDGITYYRVQLPTTTVPDADSLLERVIAEGYEDAHIVIDD